MKTLLVSVAFAVAVVVRPRRRLVLAGTIGCAAIVLLWLISRTIGVTAISNAGSIVIAVRIKRIVHGAESLGWSFAFRSGNCSALAGDATAVIAGRASP